MKKLLNITLIRGVVNMKKIFVLFIVLIMFFSVGVQAKQLVGVQPVADTVGQPIKDEKTMPVQSNKPEVISETKEEKISKKEMIVLHNNEINENGELRVLINAPLGMNALTKNPVLEQLKPNKINYGTIPVEIYNEFSRNILMDKGSTILLTSSEKIITPLAQKFYDGNYEKAEAALSVAKGIIDLAYLKERGYNILPGEYRLIFKNNKGSNGIWEDKINSHVVQFTVTCEEGAKKCVNGDLYLCEKGKLKADEKNYNKCDGKTSERCEGNELVREECAMLCTNGYCWGLPVEEQKEPEKKPAKAADKKMNRLYREVMYLCYDGTKIPDGGPTSCKDVKTWNAYGQQACEGRCEGDLCGLKDLDLHRPCGTQMETEKFYRNSKWECTDGSAVSKGNADECRAEENWRFDAEKDCAIKTAQVQTQTFSNECAPAYNPGCCCDRAGAAERGSLMEECTGKYTFVEIDDPSFLLGKAIRDPRICSQWCEQAQNKVRKAATGDVDEPIETVENEQSEYEDQKQECQENYEKDLKRCETTGKISETCAAFVERQRQACLTRLGQKFDVEIKAVPPVPTEATPSVEVRARQIIQPTEPTPPPVGATPGQINPIQTEIEINKINVPNINLPGKDFKVEIKPNVKLLNAKCGDDGCCCGTFTVPEGQYSWGGCDPGYQCIKREIGPLYNYGVCMHTDQSRPNQYLYRPNGIVPDVDFSKNQPFHCADAQHKV